MGMLLLRRGATVTYCHSRTVDLAAHVASADVVIAAVGVPELIKGAWIKPGAVVIDAGYNEGNVGDVEYAAALPHAGAITPVPGGACSMTAAAGPAGTNTGSSSSIQRTFGHAVQTNSHLQAWFNRTPQSPRIDCETSPVSRWSIHPPLDNRITASSTAALEWLS